MVLRVEESASELPKARTVMLPPTGLPLTSWLLAITTPSLRPMVAETLAPVLAVELARPTAMPPPVIERICATEASLPCAMTLMLCAPEVAPPAPVVCTSPYSQAWVDALVVAVGSLLPTATRPPATASA